MEPDSSQISGGVTREQDTVPATGRNEDQSRERVPGSDVMVTEGGLVGVDEILDKIHDTASSVLQFTHNWEEIDKHYLTIESLIKERTLEVELKERSVMEKIKELEKKEDLLKEVEEREKKIGLLETSMTLRLEDNDLKHYLVSSVMRLVCETCNEEAVKEIEEKGKEVERLSKCNEDKSCELEKAVKEFDLKQKELVESRSKEAELVKESLKELEAREKELSLTDEAIKEKVTELKKKEEIFEVTLKVKTEEMELKSKEKLAELEKKEKILDDKSCELDKAMKEFELKLKEWIESSSKEAELVKESLKQLEAREKELSLLDEAIKVKVTELKKKEEIFEAEQKVKAEEMELKSKEKLAELEKKEKIFEVKLKAKAEEMDVKEKKLEERVRELELKHRELQERSIKAETLKRSREQLMAEKGSESDSQIPPAKKHKPDSHEDAVSASASSQEQVNYAVKEEIDEEPAQIHITDSEFHDFKKTMSSFMVDKIWALYDPKDNMPRFYAKIKRINKSRSCLEVTWLEPRDEESVPVACGRFKYGRSATVSYLSFSHELQPIRHGRNIAVNPKEGETWALFRDWSQSWDTNPGQHKPPYRYDLVEIILGFEDHKGVGVSFLGKVQGFVSVFKQAVQHGVLKLVITPKEMHRFSHRVPSVRLNGEEKEGVPAGSFELDPAAVPSYILLGEREPVIEVVRDGSAKDVPIIIS